MALLKSKSVISNSELSGLYLMLIFFIGFIVWVEHCYARALIYKSFEGLKDVVVGVLLLGTRYYIILFFALSTYSSLYLDY